MTLTLYKKDERAFVETPDGMLCIGNLSKIDKAKKEEVLLRISIAWAIHRFNTLNTEEATKQ